MIQEKAADYLSRLNGTPVTRDQELVLSSAQLGAFLAWVRREGVEPASLQVDLKRFSIEAFFNGAATNSVLQTPIAKRRPAPLRRTGNSAEGILGIGIDIEEPNNLPETKDYRAHEFYVENFSPSEIAYCILQPSTHLTFTGLWAAKEAIVKSGAVSSSTKGLRDVEISHDETGRPSFPGSLLTISHTKQTAVAVAVWLGGETLPVASQVSASKLGPFGPPASRAPKVIASAVALVSVVLLAAVAYWVVKISSL
jgi:phosphopantetheine--protein transferase-like protein